MSGEFKILATRDCSFFWIDKRHLPQVRPGAATGADKPAADRASTDRLRAIQTLRFKAPDQRSSEDVALLVKLFHGNKFFDEQEDTVLHEICRSMSYVEVKRQHIIIKQGDVADMCYILLKGAVGIWVNEQKQLNEEEARDESEGLPRTKDTQDGDPDPSSTQPACVAEKETSEDTSQLHATKKLQKAAVKLLVARRGAGDLQAEAAEGNQTAEPQDTSSHIDSVTGGPIHASRVKELKEGACFGETGLLHGARRNASIIASEACQLGCISKALFETKLRAAYLAKEQGRVNFLRDHLPKTLNGSDHAQVLGGFFAEQQVRRGHVLCTSGKPCDRLTLIRDGLCKVRVLREGRPQEVGEIGRGQIVGLSTIGGMRAEPFTVVCASPEVAILRMDSTDARNRIPSDLREARCVYGIASVPMADPVDCEWELWSDWTVCQFTCGNGVSLRTRDIKRSAENGGSCDSNWKEQRSCTNGECPVDCAWKDWNDWGSCSQTCGRGSSTATRDSTPAEFGGEPCVGASQRQMDCNVDPCPVDCAWSDWSDWSFSSSCGAGTKHRHRQVLVPANELGTACVGPTTQSANSAHTECPVDCELDDWGRWSLCSTTCGAGVTKRSRTVSRAASFGGAACGSLQESKMCDGGDCPVDCRWSDWSSWQACSTSCGDGNSTRSRTVSVPRNSFGEDCQGKPQQSRQCSNEPCPVPCKMSDWTQWTSCPVTCGSASVQRTRTVAEQSGNGGSCPGQDHVFEKKYCSVDPCPVDCTWDDWDDWHACSSTCGSGQTLRIRLVKTPAEGDGQDCIGLREENRTCEQMACPKHCEWQDWGDWMGCSVSCGDGTGERQREKASEAFGGLPCKGEASQNGLCHAGPCPFACQWGDWTDWECSASCGQGSKSRRRSVLVPAEYGGAECAGSSAETGNCVLQEHCPVDCQWSDWSDWHQCSVSCGQGMSNRNRTRLKYEDYGGQACFGTADDEAICDAGACPHDCAYSDWGPWSGCPVTCGNGTRTRARSIHAESEFGGKACLGPFTDERRCASNACPVDCVWSVWSDWSSCSSSCGGGHASRTRTELVSANHGGMLCQGMPQDEHRCKHQACPIDCAWEPWSEWLACSVSCGGGERYQHRNRAMPMFGGAPCEGSETNMEACNQQECPIDCIWSFWTQWSDCSKSCDLGSTSRSRSRAVTEQFGGLPCPGVAHQEEECNREGCAVDCEWGPWSRWTACSARCDDGLSKRFRDVLVPPKNDGLPCIGEDEEQAVCHEAWCPRDCKWDDWSSWTECTQSCDGGWRQRTRAKLQEEQHGGTPCADSSQDGEYCNTQVCPVDCILTDWSPWGYCSATCGSGVQARTRGRLQERNGGRPCKRDLIETRECDNAPNPTLCPSPTSVSADLPGIPTANGATSLPRSAGLVPGLSSQPSAPGLASIPRVAPNYTFEQAQAAASGASSMGVSGWDPVRNRGGKRIPSHEDISRHYPPELHKSFPQAAGPSASTKPAAPCLKDDLKATLEVYERSKSTIASMKRDWMQGEQNVVAKVAGNLTLHAEQSDELLKSAAAKVALAKAVANLASVKPESVTVTMRSPTSATGDKASNLIARYSINLLADDAYTAASVSAMVQTQSAAKVTQELQKELSAVWSGRVKAVGLSMRVELPTD
ncbi:SSPO [Symbiodinium pilosum]|uniref:SSPO protein n=1 Tax=Symbiodinium pilosum TaxID=2952 RepID=A0A812MQ06_SYMPI|nr:SSPO [Symbiodinium pilosum]